MTQYRGSFRFGFISILFILVGTLTLTASTKIEMDDLNVDVVFKPENLQPVSSGQLSYVDHESLTLFRGELYFSALDDENRWELWRSDGTPSETEKITRLNDSGMAKPRNLIVFKNYLYFTAMVEEKNQSLFRFDGRNVEIVHPSHVLGDISIYKCIIFKEKLYFFVIREGRNIILESDGEINGAFRLIGRDLNGVDFDLYEESDILVSSDRIFFGARNNIVGKELFAFDGEDVYSVGDLNSGIDDSNPSQLIEYNGEIYFTACSPDYGCELWRTDGEKENPLISVIDINPLSPGSNPKNLTVFGEYLYLSAEDHENGREIVGFDGENFTVYDLLKGNDSSLPENLIVVQDKLFFSANDSDRIPQLWVKHVDSPEAGIVKTVFSDIGGSLCDFKSVRNTLFFVANDPSRGKSLYRSDGTGYGTVEVLDDDGLSVFASSSNFVLLEDKLLFTAKRFFKNELFVAYLGTGNVKWAGIRVSNYGIRDNDGISPMNTHYPFPTGRQWEDGAKAISSYFTGEENNETQPTLLWIISTPINGPNVQKKGTTVEMMPVSGFHPSIHFDKSRAHHEDYFDYFDAAKVKVYVQVESGWAPLLDHDQDNKGLLSLLSDHLIREDSSRMNPVHSCIEGIGIDLEWFQNTEKGTGAVGTGRGKEKAIARWYDTIRKLGLKMYLKHWDKKYMPDLKLLRAELLRLGHPPEKALADIMFINDSQGFRFYDQRDIAPKQAFSKMLTKYSDWARHFSESPVGFQIAYPSDWDCPQKPERSWFTYLDNDSTESWSDDPKMDLDFSIPTDETWKLIPKLGITISESIKEVQKSKPIGIFFVDYRIRRLFPNDVNNQGSGIFQWEPYSRSLDIVIEGKGRVDTSPGGLRFKENSTVSLTAEPELGWEFKGWSGAVEGKDNSIQITMNSDMKIKAVFMESAKVELKIQAVGAGTILADPAEGPYLPGTTLLLKAIPSEGNTFTGWRDGISSFENPVKINMTSNMFVSGYFRPEEYKKQSLKNMTKDQPENILKMSLLADAASESPVVISELDKTEMQQEILADDNTEYFSLNINLFGNGNVLLDPPGNKYLKGTLVKLSANPDSCRMFDGWTGDINGSENPINILMDGTKSVNASFSSHESFRDWTIATEESCGSELKISNSDQLVIKEENGISENCRSSFVRAKKMFSQPVQMVSFDIQGNFTKGIKLRLYDQSGKLVSDLSGKMGSQTFFPEGGALGLEFFLHIPSLDEADSRDSFSVEISNLCVVAGESTPNIDILFRDTPGKTYTGALVEIVADFENRGGVPVENAEVRLNLPVGAGLDGRYEWNQAVRDLNKIRRLIHPKSFSHDPPQFYSFASHGYEETSEKVHSHISPVEKLKLKISANVLARSLYSDSWNPDHNIYFGMNLEEYMKSRNNEISSMTYHKSHLGLCAHEDGHWEGMSGQKRGSRWGIANTPQEQKIEVLLGKYWNEVFFNRRMEGFRSPFLEYNIAPGYEMSTTTPLRTSLSNIVGKSGFRYLVAVKEAPNPAPHDPDGKTPQDEIPARTCLPSWPVLCDEIDSGGTNSVGSVLEAYRDHRHDVHSIPVGTQQIELGRGSDTVTIDDEALISAFDFKDSLRILREYTHRHFTTVQDEIPRSYISGERGVNGIFRNIPVIFGMGTVYSGQNIPKNWRKDGRKTSSWIFDEQVSTDRREDIVQYIQKTFPHAVNVTHKEILDYYLGRSTHRWLVKMPETPGRYAFVLETSDGSSKSLQIDVRSPDQIYDALSIRGIKVESVGDIMGKRMLGYTDIIYSVKGTDGIDRSGVELDRIIGVAQEEGMGVYCHIDVFRDRGMHTSDTLDYKGNVVDNIAEPVDATYRSILKSIVSRLSGKDIKGIILEAVIPSENTNGHTAGYSERMTSHFKKYFSPPPPGTNFQDPTSETDALHYSIYSSASTSEWRPNDIFWLYYDIRKMAEEYFDHSSMERLPYDENGVRAEDFRLCRSGLGKDDTGVTSWDEWEAWGEFRKYMVADFVNDVASAKNGKPVYVMVEGAATVHQMLYRSLMCNSSDPVEFADITRRPSILPDMWNLNKKDHINGIIYSVNYSKPEDIEKASDIAYRIDYWVAKGGNTGRGMMPENKFRPSDDSKVYCLYLNTENIAPGKLFDSMRDSALKSVNPYGVIVTRDISSTRLNR